MKHTELNEIKKLDVKVLLERARVLQKEIAQLLIDKNLGKTGDLKSSAKKRDDLARVLTIFRQKTILAQLEAK